MKALCFGSMNVDKIYTVDHFAAAGETVSCTDYSTCAGGKGLNQAIALSKAGIDTYMAGCIGPSDTILVNTLMDNGVNTKFICKDINFVSGHAIIQIDKKGQNCITVFRGANLCVTKTQIDFTISQFAKGDYLLLQNEIAHVDYIVNAAYKKGMTIVLNPSPMRDNIKNIDFSKLDYVIVNELEIVQLLTLLTDNIHTDELVNNLVTQANFTKQNKENARIILQKLYERCPNLNIVLTLGENGSIYFDGNDFVMQKAYSSKVVDTTAAGDTFMGYFCAGLIKGKCVKKSMDIASKASSITVSGMGASASIPKIDI